jgi:hypothetical protein
MTNHRVPCLITPIDVYKIILTVCYFHFNILLISITLFPLSSNSMMFCFFRILGGNSCSILYIIVYLLALFHLHIVLSVLLRITIQITPLVFSTLLTSMPPPPPHLFTICLYNMFSE